MPSRPRFRDSRTLSGVIAILLVAAAASAQTVIDPQKVEFDPSADHSSVNADGTPVVQRYTLTIFQSGATSPYETLDMGKPAPEADGKIRIAFVPLLGVPLLPDVIYLARIDAVGPTGLSTSPDSNTFAISSSSSCSPAISPSSASVPSTGGTVNATVAVASGCAWTAVANDPWITIVSGQGGTGSGTSALSVAANPASSSRTGSATLATRLLVVGQDPAPCSYTISPASQSFAAAGGSGSFSLGTGTGCGWTATSGAGWITVAASGTGNATVAFTVASNPTLSARSGAITAGGKTFTVTQAAMTCTYAVAPASQSLGFDAGSGSFGVTAPAGCTWNAVASATWLAVVSGASGAGNGTVTYAAAANTTTSPRTGTIAAGGQGFTLSQAAYTCTFSLTPASQGIPASGGVLLLDMSAPAGCKWRASSSVKWITVASGATGSGAGTITINVAANGSAPRSGTVSAGGQSSTITQQAPSCIYSLSPTSAAVGPSTTSGSVSVTATSGCAWSAKANVDWITVTSGLTGTGSGSVAYTVAANLTTADRTGTITIAGQMVTVTQRKATGGKR